MKKLIFIVFMIFCLSINSYSQNQSSLQDTTWKYVGNEDDDKYTGFIEFRNNGQAIFIDQYGIISNGTWEQDENYVKFDVNVLQSFTVFTPSYKYVGKITDGNIIEGTAFLDINISDFETWYFRMEKVDI